MTERNIFQLFTQICRAFPDKPCLKFKTGTGYKTSTYADMEAQVASLRFILMRSGVKCGERVAILLSNAPFGPTAFFAVTSIQAVAVFLDTQMHTQDLRRILSEAQVRFLLTEEKFGVSLGEIVGGLRGIETLFLDRIYWAAGQRLTLEEERRGFFGPHKLAALFYTSGTTQGDKGVMLTHGNLLADFDGICRTGLLSSSDVAVSMLPLHHAYPFMASCLAPLLVGATVCYVQSLIHYELFACMRENRATVFIGVPQLLSLMARTVSAKMKARPAVWRWSTRKLLDLCGPGLSRFFLKELHAAFGPDLRYIVSGGAKLDPGIAAHFCRWGFKIVEGYGLTETSPVVTLNVAHPKKFHTVGQPIPGVQVKAVDLQEDGNGEIAVRGGNVMLGYYRSVAATRRAFRDQWFLTGDLGTIDPDGFVTITGRKNEILVLSNGKKINPEKIEAHYLATSPFIKDMCVFVSSRGPEAGRLVAVIVPHEEELRAKNFLNVEFKLRWELDAAGQTLASYQRVQGFVLTKEVLPRTRLGKLIRYKIEERYVAGGFSRQEKKDISADRLSAFERTALSYLSKILKKEVRLNDHLELDLGLDSLGRIELLSALQDIVSVGIDDALALELFESRTVRELITKAHAALPEGAFSDLVQRDDAVFWTEVMREMPSAESLARLKMRFDGFDRFVGRIAIWLFKIFTRVLFSVKVRGRAHIPAAGPFVVTPNHATYLDPFFVICALPTEMLLNTYFVGFAVIFRHPLIAWAIKCGRLIPIDTNLDLAETLRICRYVLSQGKILVYFPEGQRSGDGQIKEFRKGIGILMREAHAKALPMYLQGAYETWPRTRKLPRLAPVTIKIGPIVQEEAGTPVPGGQDIYVTIAEQVKKAVEKLQHA
jgi:long-chain acyl-CoA synthetase